MVTLAGLEAALVYGLLQGMLLGAVALGLSLIWGVMKVINLAHGELVVLGAYALIVASRLIGLEPLLGPLVGFALGLAVGAAIYLAILDRLIGKVDVITLKEEMATLLAMFGLSIFLYKLFFLVAERTSLIRLYDSVPATGLYSRLGTVSVAGVPVEAAKIYVALVSLAAVAATHFFLSRTRSGMAVRAVAQDSVAVSLVGLSPVRAKLLAAALGIALTVMSGGLVALYHSTGISPELSHIYAPLSFAIVVLGTPGNVWGTLAAGIIVGLIISFVYAFTQSMSLGVAAAFAVLVATLALRPEGLFARR